MMKHAYQELEPQAIFVSQAGNIVFDLSICLFLYISDEMEENPKIYSFIALTHFFRWRITH